MMVELANKNHRFTMDLGTGKMFGDVPSEDTDIIVRDFPNKYTFDLRTPEGRSWYRDLLLGFDGNDNKSYTGKSEHPDELHFKLLKCISKNKYDDYIKCVQDRAYDKFKEALGLKYIPYGKELHVVNAEPINTDDNSVQLKLTFELKDIGDE